MSLAYFQSDDRTLSLLQTSWSQQLNPIINSAPNNSTILTSVALVSGTNTINHLLGRKLQGWKIVRQRSSASIYDNQDNNQQPTLTLILISNAAVVVDIEVF